ncbi:MAG: thioredoxin family protein [Chitinophagaceae bacterium]|nr:thioredoxin family protein [Chitinophagaceae bacterium]
MKLLFALLSLFSVPSTGWLLDFEKAKQAAQNENKYILLNFSGSDWCGPCIQLHKEIFDAEIFEKFSMDHLVLVNADFPRSKKHALSMDQQKKNDQLADSYNKKGIFPFTILLTAEGKVVKTWEGLPSLSADQFIKQVQSIMHAGK